MSGKRKFHANEVEKLVKIFGKPVEYLMALDDRWFFKQKKFGDKLCEPAAAFCWLKFFINLAVWVFL